jgi:peptidoglycan/xylan/chitin deacetylase (PgdA/CDA1 family)
MMTIGLHCRIASRPGRFGALQELVEYISKKEDVWVATRTEIAEAFKGTYPYERGKLA